MITEEMKKKYIESGGLSCLFCGSDRITADLIDVDGSEALQSVSCKDCKGTWKDILRLSDVIMEE